MGRPSCRKRTDFLVNLHQRCGYSDFPFARKDAFLYRRAVGDGGSGNGLERLDGKDPRTKFIEKDSQIIKKGLAKKFCKSQNGFAYHPSPILKRPTPFFKRPNPISVYLAALAAKYFQKKLIFVPLGMVTLFGLLCPCRQACPNLQ